MIESWRAMEAMPMSDAEDVPGDDEVPDEFVEEFERHRDAIFDRLYDYMEKTEINEAYVAQLLVDAMIRMRMTAYGVGVESPSVAGLKLDLDRLRNEVGEFLREAKKGAEEYIGHIKKMRAEDEKEDEESPE
jgi:hypothetical protein